jgi:chemotaxis protein CheX
MENKYLTPFIDATIMVLETMASVKPIVGETCIWNKDKNVAEVVGLIGFSNEDENIKGFMTIGFTKSSIIQVVSNMLGEEFETLNDEVREAVGELANMISGQARQKISLMGNKLEASMPTIISGKDLEVKGAEGKDITMVNFGVEKGLFELGICLEGLSG